MNEQYTASVYCNKEQIAEQTGDNIDKLYTWMLIKGSGIFGDVHGAIIDNKTKKTIRTFCKSPVE
ncbi:MAG: hypothetical protein P4L65_06785 [Legionella sp.]|nr:hypothetical protein [Legionella sp.]